MRTREFCQAEVYSPWQEHKRHGFAKAYGLAVVLDNLSTDGKTGVVRSEQKDHHNRHTHSDGALVYIECDQATLNRILVDARYAGKVKVLKVVSTQG